MRSEGPIGSDLPNTKAGQSLRSLSHWAGANGFASLKLSLRVLVIFWAGLIATPAVQFDTVKLTGDLGFEPQVVKDLKEGSRVDARKAVFHVANSANPLPTARSPCEVGDLPVNRYPLQIRESPEVTLLGGLFSGSVPQLSEWQDTYCNSAGVVLRNSAYGLFVGLRLRRVWDAVRITENSSGFQLRGSWISEVRDDCIENDYINGGLVEDTLFDGCFSGLSMRPPEGEDRLPDGGPFVLSHVLMRMQPYPYKEQVQEGPPFKLDGITAEIEIHDSILAMGDRSPVSQMRLEIGWSRIGDCSGNLLLWTADTPWPADFAMPPQCFRIVVGAEARAIWQEARRNWIDCHPKIQRFEDDRVSNKAACDPDGFGGKQ